jgi:hypothetical protein
MNKRKLLVAIMFLLCRVDAQASPLPSDRVFTIQNIENLLPKTALNLTVIKSPLTYYRENCQPIDPESMFEFAMVAPLLWPPDNAPWKTVRWIKPEDVSWCAYSFSGEPAEPETTKYCAFGILTSNHHRDSLLSATMRRYADAKFEINGQRVYKFVKFHSYPTDPISEKYICLAAPGLLICSNNKEQITQILDNKLNDAKEIHLCNQEMENVDKAASCLGVWHFTPTEKEQIEDTKSVGYSFSYRRDSGLMKFDFLTNALPIPSSAMTRLISDYGGNALLYEHSALSSDGLVHVLHWTFVPSLKSGYPFPLMIVGSGGIPRNVYLMKRADLRRRMRLLDKVRE